jgi:hypothetical protein
MLRWIARVSDACRCLAGVAALSLTAVACKTDSVAQDRVQAEQTPERREAPKIAVKCHPAHQLDPQSRNAVEAHARRVYAHLRAGESESIWASLHPRAQIEDKKGPFMEALESMHGRLQDVEGDPVLDALHVIEVRGGTDDLARVFCEGMGRSESFTLYTNVAGEDLAIVMLRSEGGSFGLGATMQMRKSGARWQLVGIQVNPVTYEGRDARQWEAIADDYWRADKPMPAYLALGVAQSLSTRGASIETESKTRINEKLESLRSDKGFAEDTSTWTIDGESWELAGVSLASTRTDISPVIKYVSPGGVERDVLEREADVLVAHLRRLHPELGELFEAVVFEAYAQAPSEAGRSYDAYRLARFLDPSRPSPGD